MAKKRDANYKGNKGGEANATERRAHLNRVKWLCPYCGTDLRLTRVAIDHVTPQLLGGTKGPSNQVACCVSCNSSKQAKTLTEFSIYKGDAEIEKRVRRATRRQLNVEAAREEIKAEREAAKKGEK